MLAPMIINATNTRMVEKGEKVVWGFCGFKGSIDYSVDHSVVYSVVYSIDYLIIYSVVFGV